MFRKCFQVTELSNFQSLTLLILRVIFGIAFLYHGWGKIQSPFSWMPPESPVPGIFQFLAALSEFGGGVALIIGLLMPLAMLGLSFTMLVATLTHAIMMGDPFVNMKGGSSYEPALVYLGVSLFLMALGPGKFSLDAKIFGTRK